jgi:hypothetical protein
LLEIGGVPLIMHVVNRARLVSGIDRIIVATDDDRIRRVVEAAGAEAMMTSAAHRTGTDRLAEVAARIDAGIIVNIQGDEPLIEPATVEAAIAPLLADPTLGDVDDQRADRLDRRPAQLRTSSRSLPALPVTRSIFRETRFRFRARRFWRPVRFAPRSKSRRLTP